MSSLQDLHLECNNRIKINFNGGELSSDSGLLLLYEYINKLKIPSIIAENFSTDTKQRIHSDSSILMQRIFQNIAGYFQYDDADELAFDPIFTQILSKERLASQPTISRFMNRLDDICLCRWMFFISYYVRRFILMNIQNRSFLMSTLLH